MMPGQEKIVLDYYNKNPSATASLKGTIYEDKILKSIKSKAKSNVKNINKDEAEKILKSAHDHSHEHPKKDNKGLSEKKKTTTKKAKTISKKAEKSKKVSKK